MDDLFMNLEYYMDGLMSLDSFKDYFYDLALRYWKTQSRRYCSAGPRG